MGTQLRNALVVTSLIAASSAAAQFDALPDSNATWMTSFWIGPGYPYEGYFYQYDPIDPDTLIDGEVFKRLSQLNNFGAAFYAGALRDNELGQVYYCPPNETTAGVLYDFNVLPGDTVQSTVPFWLFEGMRVLNVDTITLNGTGRKRIEVESVASPGGPPAYWIQGIGGTSGLLHTCGCSSVSGNGWLVCMTVNDTIQYGNNVGGVGACDVYLGLVEEEVVPSISFRPNPSQGEFIVGVSEERVIRCTVFDPQGREVQQVLGNSVDVSGSAPGVYTVVVRTDQRTLRAPLVLER